jgi:hypothetical protein
MIGIQEKSKPEPYIVGDQNQEEKSPSSPVAIGHYDVKNDRDSQESPVEVTDDNEQKEPEPIASPVEPVDDEYQQEQEQETSPFDLEDVDQSQEQELGLSPVARMGDDQPQEIDPDSPSSGINVDRQYNHENVPTYQYVDSILEPSAVALVADEKQSNQEPQFNDNSFF